MGWFGLIGVLLWVRGPWGASCSNGVYRGGTQIPYLTKNDSLRLVSSEMTTQVVSLIHLYTSITVYTIQVSYDLDDWTNKGGGISYTNTIL